MRQILHISDVHFGPAHLPELSEAVVSYAGRGQPDLIVLSGDLTQRAKRRQFEEARAFVDRLPAPTIVVPGNHDVPLYRVWERALAPYRAYRRSFAEDLEPVWEDDELFVIGINTAFNWTRKHGRIRLARLREVAARLREAPEGKLRIVVAHHHLIPPPRFGSQSVAYNAEEALKVFTDVGVDLVLSGHQHQTYIGTSEEFFPQGRIPVLILHAGTTTSRRGRGSEKEQNTFNWIQVEEESVLVSHYRWHRESAGFLEIARHWFPRRTTEPYGLPSPPAR